MRQLNYVTIFFLFLSPSLKKSWLRSWKWPYYLRIKLPPSRWGPNYTHFWSWAPGRNAEVRSETTLHVSSNAKLCFNIHTVVTTCRNYFASICYKLSNKFSLLNKSLPKSLWWFIGLFCKLHKLLYLTCNFSINSMANSHS